jgi:hypothetical protein
VRGVSNLKLAFAFAAVSKSDRARRLLSEVSRSSRAEQQNDGPVFARLTTGQSMQRYGMTVRIVSRALELRRNLPRAGSGSRVERRYLRCAPLRESLLFAAERDFGLQTLGVVTARSTSTKLSSFESFLATFARVGPEERRAPGSMSVTFGTRPDRFEWCYAALFHRLLPSPRWPLPGRPSASL